MTAHNARRPRRRGARILAVGAVIAGLLVAGTAVVSSSRPAKLDLPEKAWWGGPSYYEQFDNASQAGWTKPGFFPLAVYYGKPEHSARLADVGINTFMAAEYDGSPVSMITDEGISVLAQLEWQPEDVAGNPYVVGWRVTDECEMGYSGCQPEGQPQLDQFAYLEAQRKYVARAKERGDQYILQANFGNGVLRTHWAQETMHDHVELFDITSVDKYAYTSPHVRDLYAGAPAWTKKWNSQSSTAYGWLQTQMETFMDPQASKPNWVFVETAQPFLEEEGAQTIQPRQISGAVWNAIIHGAGGIAYFQHNNNGQCGIYSLVECGDELRDHMRELNRQVQRFAPVINTPSYEWTFGTGLATSLKEYQYEAYIFAMTSGAGVGKRTFTLPEGIGGSTVEVVDTDRRIPVVDGQFTDTFPHEYSYRIYRIPLQDGWPPL